MLEVSAKHRMNSLFLVLLGLTQLKMFLSLLQLLVNRTKRKRRRKRVEKGAALTGSERVKVIDIRTGKKVRELIWQFCHN